MGTSPIIDYKLNMIHQPKALSHTQACLQWEREARNNP